MITGSVNIDNSLASLAAIESRFRDNAKIAVAKTAKVLVSRIINRTLAPAPPPSVKYYVRVNRLVRGWRPAAEFLGLGVPGLSGISKDKRSDGESDATLTATEDQISFLATNGVRYASAVETVGTWGPGKVFRGGYGQVRNSSRETQDDLAKNIAYAWNIS